VQVLSANEFAGVVFSGLAPLVVEEIADDGEVIRVRARAPGVPVDCPDCGGRTGRVHAFHERTVTDVPVDARRVVVVAQVRRLVCPTPTCPRVTFREQFPGLLERYQRRTARSLAQVRVVVVGVLRAIRAGRGRRRGRFRAGRDPRGGR
jgi:transposase